MNLDPDLAKEAEDVLRRIAQKQKQRTERDGFGDEAVGSDQLRDRLDQNYGRRKKQKLEHSPSDLDRSPDPLSETNVYNKFAHINKKPAPKRPTFVPTQLESTTAQARYSASRTSSLSKAMGKKTAQKFYAVKIGRNPGIYTSWAECLEQVDRYPGARHKSFKTRIEAEEFLGQVQPTRASSDGAEKKGADAITITSTERHNHQSGKRKAADSLSGFSSTDLTTDPHAKTRPKAEAKSSLSQSQPTSTDSNLPSPVELASNIAEDVHTHHECIDLTGAVSSPNRLHDTLSLGVESQIRKGDQSAESPQKGPPHHRHAEIHQQASKKYAPPHTPVWNQNHSPDFISLCSSDCEDPLLSDLPAGCPLPGIDPIDDGPALCKEQSDLVDKIVAGHNVFYTGSAGCGKSTVLKAFVRRLKVEGKKVYIVAPTGRAALDVNGSTTWTYAGWTPDLMKLSSEKLEQKAWRKLVRKRMEDTDVLVIDEISMMENHHFERLNRVLKSARRSSEPFGGVQLVVTGDFCQLPPVKPFEHCIECGMSLKVFKNTYTCSKASNPPHGPYYDEDKWAFRSAAWKECQFQHVNLTSIHRQSDAVFIAILEKCRLGKPLTLEDTRTLLLHESETTNAVQLFPTRAEVKRVNDFEFAKLDSPTLTFTSVDTFKWNDKHQDLRFKGNRAMSGGLDALKDHRFEYKIELKKGMLVILLVNLNLDLGLVNGSQGEIIDFVEHKAEMLPEQMGEYDVYKRSQIEEFIEHATAKRWPVVRFTNGQVHTIKANCTVNELGDSSPHSLLSRTQIPLIAAWAMSIHKSQGMTLDRVVVDLRRAFEEGQVYVALSRARSLEGLKVESLGACKFSGDEQVKEFLFEKFGVE